MKIKCYALTKMLNVLNDEHLALHGNSPVFLTAKVAGCSVKIEHGAVRTEDFNNITPQTSTIRSLGTYHSLIAML